MPSIIKNETNNALKQSEIQQYFTGTTVFITGGTGFLGKLILEKLLRTCNGIKKIYVLIRAKHGESAEKRFENILKNVVFDRLKLENLKFAEKICVLEGDCVLPNLGINEKDLVKLIQEVNCVFHCAATVRFDEKLRIATYINVRATRDLLALSKEMKQLKSFVYVSTAYSNCIHENINEDFYNPPITGENLLSLVDGLNDNMLDRLTPTLIGNWPNTYTFSKAAAEEVVKSKGEDLPVAVVRPSIIMNTAEEPIAGWIDNFYGAAGVTAGVGSGLIRTAHCNPNCLADLVPADFVINCTIAAAWEVGTKGLIKRDLENHIGVIKNSKQLTNGCNDTITIYNYVSSTQRPMTWRNFQQQLAKQYQIVPPRVMIWYPFLKLTSSYSLYKIYALFLHKTPAYIVDALAYCLGKKFQLVKKYQKVDKFLHALFYFANKQWNFQNNNTQALWKKLNRDDQKMFNFNMDALNWDTYFDTCVKGARVHLLKDPLDTLPQARIKHLKFKIAHYVLVILLMFRLGNLLPILWKAISLAIKMPLRFVL